MPKHTSTGLLGEQVACDYLSSLGYQIIDRNFRAPFGEIDIVARDTDGTLAIVEVKALRTIGNIRPEDNLTRSKFLKLSRVALFYANKHPAQIIPPLGFRIDLVAIILEPYPFGSGSHTINGSSYTISHYKNISF